MGSLFPRRNRNHSIRHEGLMGAIWEWHGSYLPLSSPPVYVFYQYKGFLANAPSLKEASVMEPRSGASHASHASEHFHTIARFTWGLSHVPEPSGLVLPTPSRIG